jgi:hypothetical protein
VFGPKIGKKTQETVTSKNAVKSSSENPRILPKIVSPIPKFANIAKKEPKKTRKNPANPSNSTKSRKSLVI